MTDTKNKQRNLTGLMAVRKNSYFKHFTPEIDVATHLEASVQQYLETRLAGEDVLVTVTAPDCTFDRFWEWNSEEFKHGVSSMLWLQEKLTTHFEYSPERVDEHLSNVARISVVAEEYKDGREGYNILPRD